SGLDPGARRGRALGPGPSATARIQSGQVGSGQVRSVKSVTEIPAGGPGSECPPGRAARLRPKGGYPFFSGSALGASAFASALGGSSFFPGSALGAASFFSASALGASSFFSASALGAASVLAGSACFPASAGAVVAAASVGFGVAPSAWLGSAGGASVGGLK